MLAFHAPSSFINPLHFYSSTFSLCRLSLFPTAKLLYFHSRKASARTLTAMSMPNANSGDSSPEHVAGKWYSVPDLRLRDHRFTVPLDYSVDRRESPTISIFAREVVAGIYVNRIFIKISLF